MSADPNIEATRAGRRLALYSGLLFASVGVYLPYWPLWLASRGQGEAAIGLLLAASVAMRIVVGPLIAIAADRRGAHRRLLGLLSIGAFIGFALHAGAHGFAALFALALLCGALWAAIIPLTDSFTLLHTSAHDLDYGRIRRWGSLAFLVMTLVGGLVLRGRDPSLILWLLLGPLGLTALASPLLPALPPASGPRRRPPPLRALLRAPWLVIFCVAAALVYASHGVLYGFASIHWRSLGISEDRIGVLWTVGVLAEIVVFSLGARLLGRVRPIQLAIVAGLASVGRWIGLATATSFIALLPLQLLHGLTFSALHLAAMAYLHRSLPAEASATGQSVFAAATSGFGFAVGFGLAGGLYAAYGGASFLTMAAFAGLATIVFAGAGRRWPTPRLGDASAAERGSEGAAAT